MSKRALAVLLLLCLGACTQSPDIIILSTPTSTQAIPTQTPLPTMSPTLACPEPTGKVIHDQYQGKFVDSLINILVYLPPCYDTTTKSFPVIYLLHGKPGNQDYWFDLHVVDAANAQIQSTGSGFIMVMPTIPEPLFCSTDGGPWSYETEFTDNLLPYVEAKYRMVQSPQSRALAGISRGGIWALEIGLARPDLIGTVVALSPALSVNYPRPEYDPFNLAAQATSFAKYLFVAGEMDWAKPETIRLADYLDSLGVNSELLLVAGDHQSSTWVPVIPQMLLFISKDW